MKTHGGRNWPLRIGGLVVLLVTIVAVAGPWLAPHDPMARAAVIQIDGRWIGPPYPMGAPGFWLGSDRAGRDLLSRLLWALQPTLALVLIIAAVRLALGLTIGLAAGYATGAWRRVLDTLLRVALALPVLVVALIVIAFVGIQRGILAFILGLCLTGWAETARYVETQTRTTRANPFVEAARSMGANDGHIVIYHILRHVLPLASMLLAFEVSNTLMTTAALGFLGYYIGGGAWFTVEDWVARNTAGMPELGQMLAVSLERILDPWSMVLVGGVVTLIVLGFTLLGEGLRRRLEGELGQRPTVIDSFLNRWATWLNRPPGGATRLPRRRLTMAAAVFAVLVVLGGGWWVLRQGQAPASQVFSLLPPGGHQWATARHDPYGTLTITATGPISPTVAWSRRFDGGLTGGPAIDADGGIYVAVTDGALAAVDSDWRPALGDEVASATGGNTRLGTGWDNLRGSQQPRSGRGGSRRCAPLAAHNGRPAGYLWPYRRR